MTVSIDAGKLGARMRSDAKGLPEVLIKAMMSAGHRGRAFIVGESPVDRGILRNAWKVVRILKGVELVNDQPYAGVVERGARPFKISRAGIDALKGWVIRKILNGGWGFDPSRSAAHKQAIAWKAKRNVQLAKISNKTARDKYRAQVKLDRKAGVVRPPPKLASTKLSGAKSSLANELDDQAESIAWAIAKKFEKYGMKGQRFVYKNLPKLAAMMDEEFTRFMSSFFNRQGV